ncbi:uncharacterized protein LOC124642073 [Helicoverpa zea]|uniref:uncharacterized protein LOC124642073 n=1 Tax=Helicoverpa zea TaxID=7113 RepID=UPI001F56AAAF|nr:uncharacterized protein LOC124642073 [Helicoverpa zea]
MFSLFTCALFLPCLIKLTHCERRIVNGTLAIGEPRYLAYFVKAPQSMKKYMGWICGGCIIHPLYILTSSACLVDVKHVYAIVGYKKYVRSEDIDKDECTKRIKKRVISNSFQKEYRQKSSDPGPHKWNYRDISVARVESPFNFRDPVYTKYCSYFPASVKVNFNRVFEQPGTEAVTFGWGHRHYFRLEEDLKDHNEEYVNYASTVVIDKELCKTLLIGHSEMKVHVHNYLLCASGNGSLDEGGKFATSSIGPLNKTKHENLKQDKALHSRATLDYFKGQIKNYRKHGPCQNDHGGPLITWIGGREYVIGVACGFQVNGQMECVGPYLYTSTFSNGEFIYCMLRYTRRSRLCDIAPEQKGYQIVEEEIIWPDTYIVKSRNNTTTTMKHEIKGNITKTTLKPEKVLLTENVRV